MNLLCLNIGNTLTVKDPKRQTVKRQAVGNVPVKRPPPLWKPATPRSSFKSTHTEQGRGGSLRALQNCSQDFRLPPGMGVHPPKKKTEFGEDSRPGKGAHEY